MTAKLKWDRGHMCREHFKQYGIGLGLGRGQELVLVNKNNTKVVE